MICFWWPNSQRSCYKAYLWGTLSHRALPAAVDENKLPQTQSVLVGKGVAIPSSGKCPDPFSEMAFIGIGMCRGIQYAFKAHQSMFKGHSYRKQILFIGTSQRTTELCLRSGSLRHADPRWLLRCVVHEIRSSLLLPLDLDI